MNIFASTRQEQEEEDYLFLFEQDETSNHFDLDLQRLNEETTQMGLLVNSIEARTREDLVRWQTVVQGAGLQDKTTFLQRISEMVSPGSGSSPVASVDEKAVSAHLRYNMEQDLPLAQGKQRQRRYRNWRTWFKEWVRGKKSEPVATDSDSEGLLVMNSVGLGADSSPPHRVHSTVQARNFFDTARLLSSSVTLAEHKYFFGDNTSGAQAGANHSSSNESIISETTPALQIARGIKYGAITHNAPQAPTVSPTNGELSPDIRTPPFLQAKHSKSTSSVLTSLRKRSMRGRSLRGGSLRRHHL